MNDDYNNIELENSHKLCELSNYFYNGFNYENRTRYLPKWSFEDEQSYRIRLDMTTFPESYKAIVDSLVNLVLKKEPILENLDLINFDNFDNNRNNFNVFLKRVITNSVLHGLSFVTITGDSQTGFKFENIDYLKLRDFKISKGIIDSLEFRLSETRVLKLFRTGGAYLTMVDNKWITEKVWENTLGEIPIVSIVLGFERSNMIVNPTLLSILNLSKTLLMKESFKANILSKVAKPIPIINTSNTEDIRDKDVNKGIVFTNKDDKFYYTEIQGKGVDFLIDDIRNIKNDIRDLSYNILGNDGLNSKTRIEAQDMINKNSSFLISINEECESKFMKIFSMYYNLNGLKMKDNASFTLKKNFDEAFSTLDQLNILKEMSNLNYIRPYFVIKKMIELSILGSDFDIEKETNSLDNML